MRLPVPMMNILNGGKHADNSVDFQEFMVMPVGAPTFAEALRYGAETFHALQRHPARRRATPRSVGDEGGFAPNLKSNDEACEVIIEAIKAAGYKPGKDIAIALDPAASSFFEERRLQPRQVGPGQEDAAEMTDPLQALGRQVPDRLHRGRLAENDWAGSASTRPPWATRIQIVGDDIYVTNTRFIARGMREDHQRRAHQAQPDRHRHRDHRGHRRCARQAGWGYVISHRSGETEDAFMADFAVAMGGGQIKTGSACRSERIAKYNRLLEIEAELGDNAVFFAPFSF